MPALPLKNTISGFLKSTVAKNFILLGGIQSANLVIPLLLTPYLIKVVGINNFGRIVLTQSIVNSLGILVDYGFNISSTRAIAINKSDSLTLNSIYSTTIYTKLLLLAVSGIILLALLFLPVVAENKTLVLYSFLMCAGQAILPTWVFQGLEKNQIFALINVFFKGLYVISVFVFIKTPAHYIYSNFLLGISIILTGISCLLYLFFSKGFRFVRIPFKNIITSLKDGLYYFLSSFAINIYLYTNSLILGFFTDYKSVGLYGIAEKVLQVAKQVLIVYSQVVYPPACRLAASTFTLYKRFLQKAYFPFLFAFIAFGLLLYFNAERIAHFFNATDIGVEKNLIAIVVLSLFATCLNIPAYITLLAYHFPKSYSSVLIGSSLLSIITNICLTSTFGLYGCIINILIIEVLIMVGLHTVLQFKHKQYAFFFNTKQ